MIEETLADTSHKMESAVRHTRAEIAKIRTGRANPGLITDLLISYYGAPTPLQQLAGVSAPEPRMLVVAPYDRKALKDIERAIQASDLGLNPSNDGEVIRVMFPDLTQERRRQFVRLTKERAEEGRTALRNVRRHAKGEIDRWTRDGEVSEDEARRADKRLQELTDQHVQLVDQVVAAKEKELLEV